MGLMTVPEVRTAPAVTHITFWHWQPITGTLQLLPPTYLLPHLTLLGPLGLSPTWLSPQSLGPAPHPTRSHTLGPCPPPIIPRFTYLFRRLPLGRRSGWFTMQPSLKWVAFGEWLQFSNCKNCSSFQNGISSRTAQPLYRKTAWQISHFSFSKRSWRLEKKWLIRHKALL